MTLVTKPNVPSSVTTPVAISTEPHKQPSTSWLLNTESSALVPKMKIKQRFRTARGIRHRE